MRVFYSMTVLAILVWACSLAGKCVMARILLGYGVQLPIINVNPQWAVHIRKSCVRELAEMEKEVADECELELLRKAGRKYSTSIVLRLTQKGSYVSLTALPSNLREMLSHCLSKSYHFVLPFHLSSVPAGRHMAERSSKAATGSDLDASTDIFEVPIYVPPEFLFPPPPPPSKFNQEKKVIATDVSAIITLAASVAGIVVVFALAMFCYLKKDNTTYKRRDDRLFLTSASTDLSPDTSTPSENKDNRELRRNGPSSGSSLTRSRSRCNCALGSSQGRRHGTASTENLEPLPSRKRALFKKSEPPLPPPPPPEAPPLPPKAKPQPPPPPPNNQPPPAPPTTGKGLHRRRSASAGEGSSRNGDRQAPRAKLKPFFWDKVVGSADHSMVWDEIREGSFQFNEQDMESLFSYSTTEDKKIGDRRTRMWDACHSQVVRIIDPKKSQNLSILLKALNVTTDEVRAALIEGDKLPTELLQTLMRMAPTPDEELKLRGFDGELNQLGPVERFLKVLVDIPFVSKRMESLMFMMTFKEEASSIKEFFVTLEVACDDLKKSRLFLKLLEAVLKTGNRMNDGTYRGDAQAFRLDTLLKLSDVKGTDGKTTLLHFVVQEIIRTEGMKAVHALKEHCDLSGTKSGDYADDSCSDTVTEDSHTLGLQVVSSISSELEHVKKAAVIDAEGLTATVSKLSQSMSKIKDFLKNDMQSSDEQGGFCEAISRFVQNSDDEVKWLVEEERRISELVRNTADYFHGNAGKEEGLRLFTIVRDFLVVLDKICAELKRTFAKPRDPNRESLTPSSRNHQQSMKKMRKQLFPAIADRHVYDSSSGSNDDDSDH